MHNLFANVLLASVALGTMLHGFYLLMNVTLKLKPVHVFDKHKTIIISIPIMFKGIYEHLTQSKLQ